MQRFQADQEEGPLSSPPRPAPNKLLDGPILHTLLSLAWPNAIAFSAGTLVAIAETSYIGQLGVEALAAMALVFPCVMLTMSMSGAAMGGGVASAISRALGAGDRDRAESLATHALLIAVFFGLVFMFGMLIGGRQLLELLGGKGDVLARAVAYSQVYFGGAVLTWLVNILAGVLRGTGNMKLPSLMIVNSAILQIILGGTLGLGLGPVPQFGMPGVATGSLIAYSINIAIMSWYLFSGRGRIVPRLNGFRMRWPLFADILKVGVVACFSPLQNTLTNLVFTHMLAVFGTAVLAAYGIGARLEYVLATIAFSIGIGSVPMIGVAIGAGRIARARRIAWTTGLVALVVIGTLACAVALFPGPWVSLFTDDAGAGTASRQFLRTVAPFYAFIGLASAMYFSSQGAGNVLGPVLAQTARLLFIVLGGWYLISQAATAESFFSLTAASMMLLGLLSCAAVAFTRWGPGKADAKGQLTLASAADK
ncbi:MATE family efflux transporter [Bradyrhizobium sp. SSUT112]|uniref:MATE family efflux transporter n=1 Tax=Bradyrhizobium sp. SSUT112 TaxID=3040604 RepID=UPI00244AB48C|nr:MATE family efflux transporter [Bradyrhizobium sp. SSUT112]MDH2352757.1 MATE family efflux transporter [Bradyrhizobium sp. SSUT112]